jgi:hypothetical protein
MWRWSSLSKRGRIWRRIKIKNIMCIWGEWNTHVIWKTFIWLLLKTCKALYIYNLWLAYLLLVLLQKTRKYIPTFMIACEYTNCSFYPCIKFLYLGLIALIYLRTESKKSRTEPIPTLFPSPCISRNIISHWKIFSNQIWIFYLSWLSRMKSDERKEYIFKGGAYVTHIAHYMYIFV